MASTEIASPCIRNCCLNEQDICVGCFRSLDEIKHWHKATRDEKQLILTTADTRKKQSPYKG
ncbi:DUF1289 domain-containing protein [Reinekea marina]|uniref:DUF1289 domain-containing protein n=1 Tax=Reinekea marina TaxID=1310421 RepID=A0ABV7WT89_9GAMM|nr:DUF1289 domain-containing protein [Reinekea marina]MDN3649090.1 DUF1289 domain-containing protein [Reinekea marina]